MAASLDLLSALLIWLGGIACLAWSGRWLPLAAVAVLAAARLVVADRETRRLLVPRLGAVLTGLAGGAAMIAATYGLYSWTTRLWPALAPATAELYRLLRAEGHGRPALLALVTLLSACEEILWRGRALSPGARSALGPAARAVAAAAALYGLAHAPAAAPLLMGVALGCGLVWGALRVATASLVPAIVAHALWDAAVLVLWPLA